MKFDFSVKIKIVTALAILIALQSNVTNCIKEIRFYRKTTGVDGVTEYDKRFGRLKGMLPSHGVVGYVTDKKFDAKAFYLTQYALSPLIIVNNTEPKLIVAYFSDSSRSIQFCKDNNLFLLEKLDNNVMLFSKKAE